MPFSEKIKGFQRILPYFTMFLIRFIMATCSIVYEAWILAIAPAAATLRNNIWKHQSTFISNLIDSLQYHCIAIACCHIYVHQFYFSWSFYVSCLISFSFLHCLRYIFPLNFIVFLWLILIFVSPLCCYSLLSTLLSLCLPFCALINPLFSFSLLHLWTPLWPTVS